MFNLLEEKPCAKWTLTPPAHRIAGVLTELGRHFYCRGSYGAADILAGLSFKVPDYDTPWGWSADVGEMSLDAVPSGTPTRRRGEWDQCGETCAFSRDGQCDDGGTSAAGGS